MNNLLIKHSIFVMRKNNVIYIQGIGVSYIMKLVGIYTLEWQKNLCGWRYRKCRIVQIQIQYIKITKKLRGLQK
jgi:hypothetical protein